MANPQKEQLYQLVAELLRPKELYQLIQQELDGGDKLALDMPEPDGAQRRLYTGEVIAALGRRGRVDQDFFKALTRELLRSLDGEEQLGSHPKLEELLHRLNQQAVQLNLPPILRDTKKESRIREISMSVAKTL